MADEFQKRVQIQKSNFIGHQVTEHSDKYTTGSLGNAENKPNEQIIDDAATITFCDKRVAIEDPLPDKSSEHYRYNSI